MWRLLVISAVVSCLTNSLFAEDTTNIEWLDFTGWNHADVTAGGQTFPDLFDDVDVTVQVSGDANRETHASAAGIVSVNYLPGTQTFDFDFSELLPLVVELQSTDATEKFSVVSPGTEEYVHGFGAQPTIESIPDGLQVSGNGLRITSTGAARGLVYISPIDQLTVMHTGMRPNKYERFRIGLVTVPEPHTAVLLSLGSLLLCCQRRKSTQVTTAVC